MPQSEYGNRDGLADRLSLWADRLGRDKTLPWIGLGIVADLITAAAVLNGEPEALPVEDWETEFQKQTEYDL